MPAEREAAFYEDPGHLEPGGPWHARRVRPGVRVLRYEPPEHGPQTRTVNTGSLPCWERNPEG